MQLSISIVLYHTKPELIKQLLSDIINSQAIQLSKIYLIDNSNNDYLAKLANFDPKINYIKTAKNLGYGRAHNLAIKTAIETGVTYHLVVNPDISFGSWVLKQLITHLEENSHIGLLSPKILYPNGKLQMLSKRLPSSLDIFLRFILKGRWLDRFNQDYTLAGSYDQELEIPYLSGCFMLFRVSDLVKLGNFDPRFFMYFEDTDISRRFYLQHKAWYYSQVQITHQHNKESFRSFKLFIIHLVSMLKYFNKYGWVFDNMRKKINKNLVKSLKS